MSDQQQNSTELKEAQAPQPAEADASRPGSADATDQTSPESGSPESGSPKTDSDEQSSAEGHPSPQSNPSADVAPTPQIPLSTDEVVAEAEAPAAEPSEETAQADSNTETDDTETDDTETSDNEDPEEADTSEAAEEPAEEAATSEEDPDAISMDWYILKVQSNRERSIADALRRKIAIEGLDEFFGDVVVPTEKITEFKGGKKKVVQRKLYPGYIVVHMHINDDTWFAVRETSGIGDFTGAGGKPTPMLPHEVSRIIQTDEEETDETPKLDIKFAPGDSVKVKEGTFEGFEGEVNEIDPQSGKVKVLINIFGRSTPVELEYWQVEST